MATRAHLVSPPLLAAALFAAAAVSGCLPGSGQSAGRGAVRVGVAVERIPAWAEKELAAFAAMEACYQDFLRRFVRPDGSTVVTADCHQGNIDDIVEGFFKWDKFVLLAGSDDLRAKYVQVWKHHWKFGNRQGFFRDGFYYKGYDAEHAGELLPLLWACLELAPRDRELIAANRTVAEVFTSERFFDPTKHLFRYSWISTRPPDPAWEAQWLSKWRGDCGVNTLYSTSVWLAYLTGGQEKYRQWVLDYCGAWNAAAAANGGVFPYHIDTETLKPGPNGDGRWWKGTEGGTASFDLEYGVVTPTRGWRNLPVAAAFLGGGDPKYATGLVATTKALFANRENGLPAAAYAPSRGGWFRGDKWPHDIPVLLDKAYILTWDPALFKLMDEYPVDKVTWLEQEIASWSRFTYCRRGDLAQAEAAFERARSRAEKYMQKAAAATDLKTGDDLTAVSLDKLADLDYVDGAQWAGHNGRVGGPSPGPVGYFDASGRRGLPAGVAALVRHTDKGTVELLLCNTTAQPVRMTLTGGYYGQHRIDTFGHAGADLPIGARRVRIELAPRSLADIVLQLTRCAYEPSLRPQAGPATGSSVQQHP